MCRFRFMPLLSPSFSSHSILFSNKGKCHSGQKVTQAEKGERREGGLPCRASADGPQNCSYVRTICSLLTAFVCYFLLLLLLVGTKGRRENNLPSCSFSALPPPSDVGRKTRQQGMKIKTSDQKISVYFFLCPLFASSSLAAGIAPKKEPDTDWLEFFSLFCPQSVSPFVLERRFFSPSSGFITWAERGWEFPKHDEKDILSLHKPPLGESRENMTSAELAKKRKKENFPELLGVIAHAINAWRKILTPTQKQECHSVDDDEYIQRRGGDVVVTVEEGEYFLPPPN